MIDAHCHLDFARFDDDRSELLGRARDAGVRAFIVAGVDPDGWARQTALAATETGVYAAYGLHPWSVAQMTPEQLTDGLGLLSERAAFAIGETGLDKSRHCPPESLPIQIDAMRAQLALARDRDLPVILHILGAHGRAVEILEADGLPAAGGMVHSYSGSADLVSRYEALGLYISFAGGITRPGAKRTAQAARTVSGSRLLVETDCPDQIPHGREGARNLPEWLPDMIEAVARARGDDPQNVAKQTTVNARRLFQLEEV